MINVEKVWYWVLWGVFQQDHKCQIEKPKTKRCLRNDLTNLSWVNNVITILDVPLLKNNEDPLTERIKKEILRWECQMLIK